MAVSIPNFRYTWDIFVTSGWYVQLEFMHFDIYENLINNCHDDVVIINDFDLKGTPQVFGQYGYTSWLEAVVINFLVGFVILTHLRL